MSEKLTAGSIERLLRKTLQAFIVHKGDLCVDVKEFPGSFDVSIKPHAGDMRRVVGSAGANIKAIISLFGSIGFRFGKPVNVALREPDGKEERRETKFEVNPQWKADELVTLLHEICEAAFRKPEHLTIDTKPGAGESLKIEIHAAADEHPRRVYEVSNALKTLAGFIAKTNGRNVTLDVLTDEAQAQPAAADGRFAKAK